MHSRQAQRPSCQSRHAVIDQKQEQRRRRRGARCSHAPCARCNLAAASEQRPLAQYRSMNLFDSSKCSSGVICQRCARHCSMTPRLHRIRSLLLPAATVQTARRSCRVPSAPPQPLLHVVVPKYAARLPLALSSRLSYAAGMCRCWQQQPPSVMQSQPPAGAAAQTCRVNCWQ